MLHSVDSEAVVPGRPCLRNCEGSPCWFPPPQKSIQNAKLIGASSQLQSQTLSLNSITPGSGARPHRRELLAKFIQFHRKPMIPCKVREASTRPQCPRRMREQSAMDSKEPKTCKRRGWSTRPGGVGSCKSGCAPGCF